MRSPTNIIRHEWIGLCVEVVDAQNIDLIGIQGEIVDETKNLFVIETNKGEKKILKKGVKFKIEVDNQKLIIDGDVLVGKSEDRIKK